MGEHRSERRGEHRGERRVTIAEAAELLGISKDAVRMRVRRDTLRHEKAEGRMYVWVDTDQGADQNADHPGVRHDRTSELIDTFREQLAEEREARRRADTIIAQLARANEEQSRTIRELEAPSEPPSDERESTETAAQEPEGAEPRPDAPGDPEGTQPRPWWRRVFGG